jgi:hypothetical protein
VLKNLATSIKRWFFFKDDINAIHKTICRSKNHISTGFIACVYIQP